MELSIFFLGLVIVVTFNTCGSSGGFALPTAYGLT